MGIPGSDDIMLNYQTTSFHDALYARKVLGLKPAPEFERWLTKMQIFNDVTNVRLNDRMSDSFMGALAHINHW
jgi:ethanolamine ammonia-lyase large subunit